MLDRTTAGEFDRRITLQEKTSLRTTHNQPTYSWATVATVWAKFIRGGGKEAIEIDKETAVRSRRYMIRYSSDVSGVNEDMRILDGTEVLYITYVDGNKREGYFMITCEKRDGEVVGTEMDSLTYSNNNQALTTEPLDMAATLDPVGATGAYTLYQGSLPNNCTLNASTGLLSFSAVPSEGAYSWIIAFTGSGDYYGTIYAVCGLCIEPAAAVTISDLEYSNNNQNCWEDTADAQGQGAYATMTPTVTTETAAYTIVGGTPAGCSIHPTTGAISFTRSAASSGANTFTAQKDGTGDYIGSSQFVVTINNKTRWLPEVNGFNVGTLRTDASVNFLESGGDVTNVGAGEVSQVVALNGTTVYAQATSNRRSILRDLNGDLIRGCELRGNGNVGIASLASTIGGGTANYTFWFAGKIYSSIHRLIATDTTNTLSFVLSGTSYSIILGSNGTLTTHTITAQQAASINSEVVVVRIKHKSTLHELEIYTKDGQIVNLTNATVSTANFLTTNLAFGSRGTTFGELFAGIYGLFYTTEGDQNTTDKSNMFTHCQYDMGLISEPPFV